MDTEVSLDRVYHRLRELIHLLLDGSLLLLQTVDKPLSGVNAGLVESSRRLPAEGCPGVVELLAEVVQLVDTSLTTLKQVVKERQRRWTSLKQILVRLIVQAESASPLKRVRELLGVLDLLLQVRDEILLGRVGSDRRHVRVLIRDGLLVIVTGLDRVG